jgi:uncharacterized protein involved in outer membrane biogenesis
MQRFQILVRRKSIWLIAIGGLIGLLILLLVAADIIFTLNANAYKPRLEASVSRALGMKFKVIGPLGIRFFPGLLLTLHDVHIDSNGVEIVSVPEAKLGIEILPLLFKQVRIESIALNHPVISIERKTDGQFNFASSARSGGGSAAMNISNISISDGILHYSNKISGKAFEAGNCNLSAHDLQFSQSKTWDLMKDVAFTANLNCGEIRNNDLTMTDLKISANGQHGIIDLKSVTMQVFGAQGTGSIHADYSGAVAQFSIQYSLPQFQIAELFKTLSAQKVADGNMDFTTDLTFQGNSIVDMKRTLGGQILLRGKDLTLKGHDLDKEIASFKSSQHFNLVDVGAVFLAGPFGLVITKGYNFASLLQGSGGNSDVTTLVSDWKVDHGVAHAQDVAMATKKNRIALKGGLDFVNDKFIDMTVAVIGIKGCAVVQQKITGSFEKPVVENQNIINTLTGPIQKLLKEGRDLLPGGKCEVFYSGSVLPPQ